MNMHSINMRAIWPLVSLFSAVKALPAASATASASVAASSSPAPTASATGNPFEGYQLYVNPYYKSQVESSAIPSLSASSLVAQASAAADVPSFYWL